MEEKNTELILAQAEMSGLQKYMESLLPGVGMLFLKPEEKEILFAPVQDEIIEIRPDGLIYLPWCEYAMRLRQVFGAEWAMIPNGMPYIKTNHVLWGFFLVLRGTLAGFAIGEQEYFEGNSRMSWSDACEGAKSNALMRLCKERGIGLEMWQPSFVRRWREAYAESYEYYNKKKGKREILWRKKGEPQQAVEVEEYRPTDDPLKKAQNSTEEKINKSDLIEKTVLMIVEIASGDKAYAENLLFEISEWNGQGFRSSEELKKLSDKRIAVIYGKTKKLYLEWQAKQEVEVHA